MLLTSSWVIDLLLILGSLSILAYRYLTRNNMYWKKRAVKFKKPTFLVGNLLDVLLLRKTFPQWIEEMYNSCSDPIFGIFMFDEPTMLIRSPELIKDILIKDFNYFVDRTVACPTHNEIVSNMMFFQRGDPWKVQRSKLTPVFTSGKLKGMLTILDEYAKKLVQRLKNHPDHVDVKKFVADYITDGITKCFFGIESYSQEDSECEFKLMLTKNNGRNLKIIWSRICFFFYPKLVNILKLEFGDQEQLNYFCDAFYEAMKARERSKVRHNDFIDIINDLRNDEEFAKAFNYSGRGALGQPFMFFIAAQGTTTSILTFILYELCVNSDIQEKVREEVMDSIKEHGGITYEALTSMKYMGMCIKETLRKYPTVSFLDRTCIKEYRMKNMDCVIPEGHHVYIPVIGLHKDEQYFPEPEKFLPERFSEKNNINANGLYYIPFGDGPRSCIGERFGILNIKLALSHILSNFRMEYPADRTKAMVYDPNSFTMEADTGHVTINFKPLD